MEWVQKSTLVPAIQTALRLYGVHVVMHLWHARHDPSLSCTSSCIESDLNRAGAATQAGIGLMPALAFLLLSDLPGVPTAAAAASATTGVTAAAAEVPRVLASLLTNCCTCGWPRQGQSSICKLMCCYLQTVKTSDAYKSTFVLGALCWSRVRFLRVHLCSVVWVHPVGALAPWQTC